MNKLLPHESAELHVSGEAIYTDDLPELAGTLHCALGLSQRAHANIVSMDFSAVLSSPGVIRVMTAADIPGQNDCGPIIHDDPILADGLVQCVGQPIFAVIANSYDATRRAAQQATIEYNDLPAIRTPKEALQQKSFVVPPMHRQAGAPDEKLNTCLLYTSPSPRD